MDSMIPSGTPSRVGRPAAVRIAIAAAALLGAAAFALDTWQRGWAPPELAVGALAILAAGAAALGRATRVSAVERAAPWLAWAGLVAALALFALHLYA